MRATNMFKWFKENRDVRFIVESEFNEHVAEQQNKHWFHHPAISVENISFISAKNHMFAEGVHLICRLI